LSIQNIIKQNRRLAMKKKLVLAGLIAVVEISFAQPKHHPEGLTHSQAPMHSQAIEHSQAPMHSQMPSKVAPPFAAQPTSSMDIKKEEKHVKDKETQSNARGIEKKDTR
jgi:hypothetical protein